MNLYNIPFNFTIPGVLKDLIITENNNNPYLIIAPNKKAVESCQHEFNSISKLKSKVKLVAISDTKELLTAFFKMASTNLKPEIIKLQNTKTISPNTRSFLLTKLIKAAKPKISLENSLALAQDIAELLDILTAEGINFNKITQFSALSTFAEDLINLLTIINNHWHNILIETKLSDILSYKNKVLNLIINVLQTTTSKTNIIIFAIDNYSNTTVSLLKTIANYSYGKVIFSGINFLLSGEFWNNLPNTHPQYINSQILNKLTATRASIKILPEYNDLPLAQLQNSNINSSDLIANIFNQLVYTIPTASILETNTITPVNNNTIKQLDLFQTDCAITADNNANTLQHKNISCQKELNINNIAYLEVANEEIEANLIVELIKQKLQQNSNNTITIVTTNIDLSKRITFKLTEYQIDFDSSFGVELSRTNHSIFFKLITTITLNNINFIDLLALLKHPLCGLGANQHCIYLIDLLLARVHISGKALTDYSNLLNSLLSTKKITDNEYYSIKQVFITLENTYKNFTNIISNSTFNFKEALNAHIVMAESLSLTTENKEPLIWLEQAGEALKAALSSILEETDFLPEVTLEEYNNIIQLLLKKHNARAPLNNKAQVFICGILQAQFITSNIVILADLNEGSFPLMPKNGIAFVNYLLQQLNLPSKHDSIGKEAFIFSKLCYYPKVYLTRSIKKQNLVTTPSRFITKLQNTLIANKLQLNSTELTAILNKLKNNNKLPKHNYSTKNNSTNNKAFIAANPDTKYRPKTISATAIEKLLQNPYLFFIEQILKLTTLSPLNQDFDARLQGNLIHEILSTLLNKYNNNIKSLSLEELKHQLLSIANYKFSNYMLTQPNAILAFSIFKYFFNNLGSSLYKLLNNSEHIDSETSGKVVITFPQEESITIKGRADCIAITTTASTLIDFKTGNFKLSKSDVEKFRKQLIILGYILLKNGFSITSNSLSNLEYWVLPNNFSDKFTKIKLTEVIKKDNLEEYITNDFKLIKEDLYNYLLTPSLLQLNMKHKISKEYEHFSRKNELTINTV